jgi:hypothetical protein
MLFETVVVDDDLHQLLIAVESHQAVGAVARVLVRSAKLTEVIADFELRVELHALSSAERFSPKVAVRTLTN